MLLCSDVDRVQSLNGTLNDGHDGHDDHGDHDDHDSEDSRIETVGQIENDQGQEDRLVELILDKHRTYSMMDNDHPIQNTKTSNKPHRIRDKAVLYRNHCGMKKKVGAARNHFQKREVVGVVHSLPKREAAVVVHSLPKREAVVVVRNLQKKETVAVVHSHLGTNCSSSLISCFEIQVWTGNNWVVQ